MSTGLSALGTLIQDLDRATAQADETRRAVMLAKIADLYLGQVDRLDVKGIDLFDEVLVRLATEIERRSRIDLARRLAMRPKAPPRTLRQLAHDEIDVARPVLEHSPDLTEDDLVSVSMTRGDAHREIVAARPNLSESVTDALSERGGAPVLRRLAANGTARISRHGFERMIHRARGDDILQRLLAERKDMPIQQVHQLIDIAGHAARMRLKLLMPQADGLAVDDMVATHLDHVHALAGSATTRLDYTRAIALVLPMLNDRTLSEETVRGFAVQERFEEVVCGLSGLSGLSLKVIESAFESEDTDRLMVIGRALNFAWETMDMIITLGFVQTGIMRSAERLREGYLRIPQKTALRVLHFLAQDKKA
ncbi:MAG: DUF2336 domain-containing protein [Beijerinckiaceae bacterium]